MVSENIIVSKENEIPDTFTKFGDYFKRVYKDDKNYIYSRMSGSIEYFEVFKIVVCEMFEDFLTKKMSGEYKHAYPSNESFGYSAWCCRSLETAKKYLI